LPDGEVTLYTAVGGWNKKFGAPRLQVFRFARVDILCSQTRNQIGETRRFAMTTSEKPQPVALTGDGSPDANRAGLFRFELFMIGVEGKPNAAQSTETGAIIRCSANKEN